MPKYEVETLIQVEIPGDEEEAYEVVDRIMQAAWDRDPARATVGSPEWHFEMLEGCVTNKTEEADTFARAATCRHCGRRIVDNPDDGWVDPEAKGDDSIWRETCGDNDTEFSAPHEPEEAA